MAKDRDSDTSAATAQAGQSKRPSLSHHVSHDSDSQLSDHAPHSQSHQRPKHHKHVVGGHGRSYSRVPSSKAVHKINKAVFQHPTTHQRRNQSPSPDQSERTADRPPMLASTHRRNTSDGKVSRDPSSSNLKKNTSHTSLKRNRSHVEVTKKSKSAAIIKRSSSHKEVTKLKGAKSQVHFDLGNDSPGDDRNGQDDEWVDASGSASPYLSRRGSVIESGQASENTTQDEDRSATPHTLATGPSTESHAQGRQTPDRETVTHKEYLTSRLLKRIPSQGAAPPMMTAETALVRHGSASPDSAISRASSTLYGTPKINGAHDELTSRFVNGPRSGVNPETGSFYSPKKAHGDQQTKWGRRPRSLDNLNHEHADSKTDDPDEDDSALAPRTRRSGHRALPADKSRTQQKLNLQRASSSIEPAAAGGGVGAAGASPLVGGGGHDNRDPRIGKLLERTGMEYLVVRRYQNPIARSIARLQRLPGTNKTQHIPKQNGTNGSSHGKKQSESGGLGRYNPSTGLVEAHRSRPATPRRAASIRTNGANSSFEAEEDRAHDGLSGSSYVDGAGQDDIAALLRNLWDKSMDLSASQD